MGAAQGAQKGKQAAAAKSMPPDNGSPVGSGSAAWAHTTGLQTLAVSALSFTPDTRVTEPRSARGGAAGLHSALNLAHSAICVSNSRHKIPQYCSSSSSKQHNHQLPFQALGYSSFSGQWVVMIGLPAGTTGLLSPRSGALRTNIIGEPITTSAENCKAGPGTKEQ